MTILTPGQRGLIEQLRLCGSPLTREAYVGVSWNDEPPEGEDWGAECEIWSKTPETASRLRAASSRKTIRFSTMTGRCPGATTSKIPIRNLAKRSGGQSAELGRSERLRMKDFASAECKARRHVVAGEGELGDRAA